MIQQTREDFISSLCSGVMQWLAILAHNQKVGGSNPPSATIMPGVVYKVAQEIVALLDMVQLHTPEP